MNRHRGWRAGFLLAVAVLLAGCLGMPSTVKPVSGFELNRYLGTWYEIARFDSHFERGLTQVTAHYALAPDGTVQVTNRGYSTSKQAWDEAQGKALFVNTPDEGYLKVSFFGPFYGSYVVFGLDTENYQYAFVCSANTDYLWLLARTPTVDAAVIQRFVSAAEQAGFDTRKLVFVDQTPR